MPEPDDEVSVVAQFTAKLGRESELLSLLGDMVGPTRREPTCLRYELNRDIDNPRVFTFAEKFRSVAGYESHLASKHVRQFSERTVEMVEARTVHLYKELLPAPAERRMNAPDENQVAVIAQFRAKPRKEADLSALLQQCVNPARGEPGCLRYEMNQDLHDPSVFAVVETYSDQQAFEAHCGQPYVRELLAALPQLADEQHIGAYRQVLPPAARQRAG